MTSSSCEAYVFADSKVMVLIEMVIIKKRLEVPPTGLSCNFDSKYCFRKMLSLYNLEIIFFFLAPYLSYGSMEEKFVLRFSFSTDQTSRLFVPKFVVDIDLSLCSKSNILSIYLFSNTFFIFSFSINSFILLHKILRLTVLFSLLFV